MAAEGLFRGVYEGCISGADTGKERRPYHRNCGCALCVARNHYSQALPKYKKVSYPIRRAWSEGSLVLAASAHSSPSSSPAAMSTAELGRPHLGFCKEEDEDDDEEKRSIFKI